MIRIFDGEEEVAVEIVREMHSYLIKDDQPVFCLTSGSTPQMSYRQFAVLMNNGYPQIDFFLDAEAAKYIAGNS